MCTSVYSFVQLQHPLLSRTLLLVGRPAHVEKKLISPSSIEQQLEMSQLGDIVLKLHELTKVSTAQGLIGVVRLATTTI